MAECLLEMTCEAKLTHGRRRWFLGKPRGVGRQNGCPGIRQDKEDLPSGPSCPPFPSLFKDWSPFYHRELRTVCLSCAWRPQAGVET